MAVGIGLGSSASASGGLSRRGDPAVLATAAVVLGQIRKAKSAAKVSMRAEAARVIVRVPSPEAADAVRASEDDLRAAGNVADFSFVLARGRRAGDRGHAGGAGYLLSRGSGPVGSRGIGRVVDWSFWSEPVDGPNRSTARSPTSS